MLKGVSDHFNTWMKVFIESSCPLCGRSTCHNFCLDCDRQLQHCQVCPPNWNRSAPIPVFSWGIYQGALKRAIAALKYEKQSHLANPLGQRIAQAWNEAKLQSLNHAIVVPIPMHESKQKQRGFNQAELIAKSFCRSTHLPLKIKGLERIRTTEAQFQLSIRDREKNLRNAFQVSDSFLKHPPANPVILLDDIYTTGATTRSAAQALEANGIRVIGIVVLAITERENPRS